METQQSVLSQNWSEKICSWRVVMVLLLQTSFVVVVFLRNCMPMALVCMVKPNSEKSSSSSSLSSSSPAVTAEAMRGDVTAPNGSSLSATDGVYVPGLVDRQNVTSFRGVAESWNVTREEKKFYEFEWDPEVEGLILTSVLFTSWIGPLLLNIVRGYLGNKLTLTLSNLVCTFLTFLSPTAARVSPYFLVGVRSALGIILGANVPIIGDSIAWWAPQSEKLTITALTYTGINIGGIMASFFSGFLCSVPVDNGWPFIFYTFGTISLLWAVGWHFLSSPKPEEHPYISETEKEYIVKRRAKMDTDPNKKAEKPPYKEILTSLPVVAFIATASCHIWASNVVFTYLPVYFTDVMEFPVEQTGLLVSLVSLCRMLGSILWTIVGNKLVSKFSINLSRKLCIFLGFIGASASQIGVAFFDKSDKWMAFGLLIVVMLTQSVGSATLAVIPLDMAPRYAGLLSGMFISVGSLISISGPLITAALTPNGTYEEWSKVWIIMGCMFGLGGLIFTLFGHASLQPWAQANRLNLPHIVSPFVTMGRRFSAFMDAPIVSPVSPTGNQKFNLTLTIQGVANTVMPSIAPPTTEQIANDMTVAENKKSESVVEIEMEGTILEIDMEETGDIDDNASGESGYENPAFESSETPTLKRKRAYSEFGLEVMRQESKNVDDIDTSNDQSTPLCDEPMVIRPDSRNVDDINTSNVRSTPLCDEPMAVKEGSTSQSKEPMGGQGTSSDDHQPKKEDESSTLSLPSKCDEETKDFESTRL